MSAQRPLSGAARRSVENAAPTGPSVPKKAYLVAWLGELGGIQHIQIVAESPFAAPPAAWPVPLLVFEGEGKSFDAAMKRCMEYLRRYAPAWTRFIRGPVRVPGRGVLGYVVAPKTKPPQIP